MPVIGVQKPLTIALGFMYFFKIYSTFSIHSERCRCNFAKSDGVHACDVAWLVWIDKSHMSMLVPCEVLARAVHSRSGDSCCFIKPVFNSQVNEMSYIVNEEGKICHLTVYILEHVLHADAIG